MTKNEHTNFLERARCIKQSPEQAERQRQSFAYGNANIENEMVTRKVVEKAANRLSNRCKEK